MPTEANVKMVVLREYYTTQNIYNLPVYDFYWSFFMSVQ